MAELGYKVVERQQMYELNPGDVDGLTPAEIQERFPAEFEMSQKQPYSHRYPRAESYHDLSVRLEPVILELEREPADVLFIGHGSVIRCLMAYLQGLTPQEIPNVELRRGDVVQVTPSACKPGTLSARIRSKALADAFLWLPFRRRGQLPDPLLLAVSLMRGRSGGCWAGGGQFVSRDLQGPSRRQRAEELAMRSPSYHTQLWQRRTLRIRSVPSRGDAGLGGEWLGRGAPRRPCFPQSSAKAGAGAG